MAEHLGLPVRLRRGHEHLEGRAVRAGVHRALPDHSEPGCGREHERWLRKELRLVGSSVVDVFDWRQLLLRPPAGALHGDSTPPAAIGRVVAQPSERFVVAYVAARRILVPTALPVLLRNVRGQDGHVHETAWLPREEHWGTSSRQRRAWTGSTIDDLEEIDEHEALAIQQARRQQVAALDDEARFTDDRRTR